MTQIAQQVKNELTLENILMVAMRMPGVKINREKFLRKELSKCCSKEVLEEALQSNPAKAGISRDTVNKIADSVINYETTKVTGLSLAASVPGGGVAVAAATADITSYFAFILRTVQELAYLYGFEQFELNENDIDSETMNNLIVFMGVMFGVQSATTTLKNFADVFANRISKKLPQRALTKGVIYPIVKRVSASVGIRMNKQIFADFLASTVPVIGGVVSGGLTYMMFRPRCVKLKEILMTYDLCDPDFYRTVDAEAVIIND